MIVICGAGPAGLYLAIKLKQAGVKDLIIYDPRAKEYTRPGHLRKEAFDKAAQGTKIDQLRQEKNGHIKELERKLLIEAEKLNINIEKKRFMGFEQSEKDARVIVTDEQGKQETIAADYVFDCSGPQRAVVNSINKLVSEPPFTLKRTHEIKTHDHLLAYLKMSRKDLKAVNKLFESYYPHLFPDSKVSIKGLTFARTLVKLRALGWKEYMIPQCYGFHFPLNKACLYMQAPNSLTKTDYDSWLSSVLGYNTKPITYDYLPPSQKYKTKPRLSAFNISAQYLEKVSYQGENLPVVIALGDAQSDSHYKLGSGIIQGMSIIDELFDTINITDGQIISFEADKFEESTRKLLRERAKLITKEETHELNFYANNMNYAKQKIKEAINETDDPLEKRVFNNLLREIKQALIKESKQSTNEKDQSFYELLAEIEPKNLELFLIEASQQEEEEEPLKVVKEKASEKLTQGYNDDLKQLYGTMNNAIQNNKLNDLMQYFVDQLEEKTPKKRKNFPFFEGANVKFIQNTLKNIRSLINSDSNKDSERAGNFFKNIEALYNELEDSQSIRTLDALKSIIKSSQYFDQYKMTK